MINSPKFKDIEGYEDKYEVSDQGEVRSKSRVIKYSSGKEVRFKGRTLKPAVKNGYHTVTLANHQKTSYYMVHRLVAMTFITNPESKPQVNHIDGDKSNNHITNLEWCTASENLRHAHKTGLKTGRGEKHSQNKLSEADVHWVRYWLSKGYTQSSVAAIFGVIHQTISNINRKTSWSHI